MVHISALFFMDLKGKILISRNYRGDVDKKQAEKCVCAPLCCCQGAADDRGTCGGATPARAASGAAAAPKRVRRLARPDWRDIVAT